MPSQIMFDRKWKIVLQLMSEKGGKLVPIKTKELRDLKVTFKVINTLLGDPSLGTFQIFNINNETESMLTSYNCYITFYSGYYSDNELNWNVLFSGEVTNSYDIRQGTDIVWNVWARDAFTLLNVTKPALAPIETETSVKTVLEKLVKDAVGLANKITYVNKCDIRLGSLPLLNEYTVEGEFKDEFDDLLLGNGFGWQVQNGEFIVFDQTNTDPDALEGQVISVSRNTGLLSVPMVDYTGVKFKSLLNGLFKPTKIIDIEPNTVRYNLGNEFYVEQFDKAKWRASGKFRIYEVTHEGDTRGDRWHTNVTAFYRRN